MRPRRWQRSRTVPSHKADGSYLRGGGEGEGHGRGPGRSIGVGAGAGRRQRREAEELAGADHGGRRRRRASGRRAAGLQIPACIAPRTTWPEGQRAAPEVTSSRPRGSLGTVVSRPARLFTRCVYCRVGSVPGPGCGWGRRCGAGGGGAELGAG